MLSDDVKLILSKINFSIFFQDDFENLRRSTQLERNQLITKLSAKEEEIRHLQVQLQVFEQRANILPSDTDNEKIRQLLQERKDSSHILKKLTCNYMILKVIGLVKI